MDTSVSPDHRRRDERGASAVEYGLLVAAIAGLVCVIVFLLGGLVKSALFGGTCTVILNNSPGVTGSCS